MDQDLAVSKLLPLDDYVAAARTETRFVATLAAVLAGIALLLACIGIYGVTSYTVLGRTPEIGIRVALGAQRANIFGLIIRQSMIPVFAGALLGAAVSLALTPMLSSLLYGVQPGDPLTFFIVAAFLLSAGLLACYLPARWAMRIEPMDALRFE